VIDSASYSDTGSASPETHALFGQTMGYVALHGFFALGAYLARDLSYGWTFVGFIAAFACLITMNFARQSAGASAGLPFAFGMLFGVAMSPTITYYADTNPQALWQADGAPAGRSPRGTAGALADWASVGNLWGGRRRGPDLWDFCGPRACRQCKST
jgi:uncharacterized protein